MEPEELFRELHDSRKTTQISSVCQTYAKEPKLQTKLPSMCSFSQFNSLKTDFSVLETRQTNVTSLICTEASLLATAQHTQSTRPPPGLNLKDIVPVQGNFNQILDELCFEASAVLMYN